MNFTQEELEKYRQALNEEVCSICQKFGYDELCGKRERGECSLNKHLPRLLEAVLSTPRSKNIADYVPRIRDIVCNKCENQDERGVCEWRDRAYCNLDSFLVLVVQTIEGVSERELQVGGD